MTVLHPTLSTADLVFARLALLGPRRLLHPAMREHSVKYRLPSTGPSFQLARGSRRHATIARRRTEFALGRLCCAQALAALGLRDRAIGVSPTGGPLWPSSITGSITHSGSIVTAVVGRRTEFESIGVDSQELIADAVAHDIAPLFLCPSEAAFVRVRSATQRRELTTLIFSMKEAIFKCLSAWMPRGFYFRGIEITSIDFASATFSYVLANNLSDRLPHGCHGVGRFAISSFGAHTITWISTSNRREYRPIQGLGHERV